MRLPRTAADEKRAREHRESERARIDAEFARRQTLPIEQRIKLWRDDEGGQEIEGVIELLCDAESALVAMRAGIIDAANDAGFRRCDELCAKLTALAETIEFPPV